jgi:hypothetical protein
MMVRVQNVGVIEYLTTIPVPVGGSATFIAYRHGGRPGARWGLIWAEGGPHGAGDDGHGIGGLWDGLGQILRLASVLTGKETKT